MSSCGSTRAVHLPFRMVERIHTQEALSLVLFLRTGKDLGGKTCWEVLKLNTRVLFRDLIDTRG